MADPEYICLSCGTTFREGETFMCSNCGELTCSAVIKGSACGGEVSTIEEYDKRMKEMYDE